LHKEGLVLWRLINQINNTYVVDNNTYGPLWLLFSLEVLSRTC